MKHIKFEGDKDRGECIVTKTLNFRPNPQGVCMRVRGYAMAPIAEQCLILVIVYIVNI